MLDCAVDSKRDWPALLQCCAKDRKGRTSPCLTIHAPSYSLTTTQNTRRQQKLATRTDCQAPAKLEDSLDQRGMLNAIKIHVGCCVVKLHVRVEEDGASPVSNARIMQAAGHKDVGIGSLLDVVHGRVCLHVLVVLWFLHPHCRASGSIHSAHSA